MMGKQSGRRWPLMAGGILALAAVALASATVAFAVLAGPRLPFNWEDYRAFNVATALGFSAAGYLIIRRHSGNLIGWLLIAGGVGNGLFGAGVGYAFYAYVQNGLPGAAYVFALVNGAWIPLPAAIAFTFAVFPDGQPLSPRWRALPPFLAAAFAVWLFGVILSPFDPTGMPPGLTRLRNPFESPAGPLLAQAGTIAAVAGTAVAAASLLLRLRRSRGIERLQLKWLALAAVPLVLTFVDFFVSSNVAVSVIAVGLFVTGLSVAILKYRLYDLDLVVNRALVYGLLSAAIVGVYLGSVAAVAHIALGPEAGRIVATLCAALVALFARNRLQLVIDRLVYGRRRQPLGVVAALGRRLEAAGTAEEVLPGAVEELGGALKLRGLEVEVDGAILASFGESGEDAIRLPLMHHGSSVGDLVVTARRGDSLSPHDLHLLSNLTPQLAVAAHALELTRALRGSREALVLAREEERRRIRRDLHDGLGPALTGIAMQADAARNLLADEPARAADLLASLRAELSTAIVEIRRLVDGLRPPALDELGLEGALRQAAGRFQNGSALRVEVESPDLRNLPAAIEVAAYRIASEAMNNVARHAGASHCRVRMTRAVDLELEVVDDGSGWPDGLRAGIGLRSMRERAEEVGGTLVLGGAPGGGGRVVAHLPLRSP